MGSLYSVNVELSVAEELRAEEVAVKVVEEASVVLLVGEASTGLSGLPLLDADD